MVLVDTSVWIEHFRGGPARLALSELLREDTVLIHPGILGELALGHLGRARREILQHLELLPKVPVVSDEEVRDLIERRRLPGRGIGWVDAHLVASALLAGCVIWSLDGALKRVAISLGVV